MGARFVLELPAGTGGMGTVWRARDLERGDAHGPLVALKLLHGRAPKDVERFGREARALAEIAHPGVVAYVAHGVTPDGQLYLAMEWLEGETVTARLARATLDVRESVALASAVAGALAAAHALGVVHRDVKPDNLFLPAGDPLCPKLLDFGIARMRTGALTVTRAGALIGTPGYMSPEQARGERDVGPGADVFSLGCVLFECLAGRPPFVADNAVAVLAKVLLEEPPRLSALRQDLPPALDDLVARMLAKVAPDRPRDGAAVVAALGALGAVDGDAPPLGGVVHEALTIGERRLSSVVVIAPPDSAAGATDFASAATLPSAPADARSARAALVAMRFGATVEPLADGSLVAVLGAGATGGVATDLAARAARCALALGALFPDARVSLATGRGAAGGSLPFGEAIDRATERLRHTREPPGVYLDEVTAGLLDGRFAIAAAPGGPVLKGERDVVEAGRTLLGRQTPCVGRERELALLSGLWSACVEEPAARAVLVTGAAGMGKSRLRWELVRSLRDAGPAHQVWMARGDALGAGSPFALAAQLVLDAASVRVGDAPDARRQRLRARVARHVEPGEATRVTEFLGELCGTPFPDEHSVMLRAARRDMMLMGDQIRRAWEDFVAAETAAEPLLIVLEDLHWGDLPSVRLVDAALRNAAERPLLVLALARPEVEEAFPRMWAERAVQIVRLSGLGKRAAEALVQGALGERADAATVARLVDRAAGNAFYLEEMIRAVAEGKGDALPESVLAMVEARLADLPDEARRAARAASVFGQVAWRGGVSALLGGERGGGTLAARTWLDALVDVEVLARRGEGRFPGEDELVFRHALLREAAYAMLTDADRALGHRLAAQWLLGAGETDALVLAEHFARGGDGARAVEWYRRAAEQGLEGNDVDAALARVARGVACGAEGAALGQLLAIEAEARRWRAEIALARTAASQAMALLPPGTERWYGSAAELAVAAAGQGDYDAVEAIADAVSAAPPADGAGASPAMRVVAQLRLAMNLLTAGRNAPAERLFAAADADATRLAPEDPVVGARFYAARALRAHHAGDLAAPLRLMTQAVESRIAAGDLRNACLLRSNVAFACLALGAHDRAEALLREVLPVAERLRLAHAVAFARQNLALALLRRGSLAEARVQQDAALDAFVREGDRRLEGVGRTQLSAIHLAGADPAAAEREARTAMALLEVIPRLRPSAGAALANALLAQGRAALAFDAASAAAREADAAEAAGKAVENEPAVALAHVEALRATGRAAEAQAAAERANLALERTAARIDDPALRESFRRGIPEHARLLALR